MLSAIGYFYQWILLLDDTYLRPAAANGLGDLVFRGASFWHTAVFQYTVEIR